MDFRTIFKHAVSIIVHKDLVQYVHKLRPIRVSRKDNIQDDWIYIEEIRYLNFNKRCIKLKYLITITDKLECYKNVGYLINNTIPIKINMKKEHYTDILLN
jgi:hypothetical protein